MEFKEKIVAKYIKGKFSLQEKIVFDEYVDNDKYSHKLDKILKKSWDETLIRNTENPETIKINKNLGSVLDKISHQILLQSSKRKSNLKKLWQFYSKVAALLLLPVIVFSLYYSQNSHGNDLHTPWVEIHSPYGARTQFSLPDGSVGWLNSGSMIRYPAQFSSTRLVSLKGEAYFKVVKNSHTPFIVEAQKIKVKVLGTEFNVVAYENDSIAEVVVASGKVEVSAKGENFKHELLLSERLVLNKQNKKKYKSKVDILNYTSWKDGRLIFLNDNLNEVVRKISRFYNVDVEIEDDVDVRQLFRAVLKGESLEELLRFIQLTMPVNFEIIERKQNKDESFSKRKVIIKNVI